MTERSDRFILRHFFIIAEEWELHVLQKKTVNTFFSSTKVPFFHYIFISFILNRNLYKLLTWIFWQPFKVLAVGSSFTCDRSWLVIISKSSSSSFCGRFPPPEFKSFNSCIYYRILQRFDFQSDMNSSILRHCFIR